MKREIFRIGSTCMYSGPDGYGSRSDVGSHYTPTRSFQVQCHVANLCSMPLKIENNLSNGIQYCWNEKNGRQNNFQENVLIAILLRYSRHYQVLIRYCFDLVYIMLIHSFVHGIVEFVQKLNKLQRTKTKRLI